MTAAPARIGRSPAGEYFAVLVVVVAVLTAARWLVDTDPTRRNYEFMPEMTTSPAVESQAQCATLPDGLAQQPLVAGVVVRGRLPLRYGPGEEEAIRAGKELTNPYPKDDADAAARGAEVFRIHCVSCHGAGGDGRGPAVGRGMLPPPSFKAVNAMQMPDGRMFHVLTHGQGNMQPLGARVDPEDRWRAVLHVRKLQEPVK